MAEEKNNKKKEMKLNEEDLEKVAGGIPLFDIPQEEKK